MKQEIVEDTGEVRNRGGKASYYGGHSLLVKLSCGHYRHVSYTRYKGIGSYVDCKRCDPPPLLKK